MLKASEPSAGGILIVVAVLTGLAILVLCSGVLEFRGTLSFSAVCDSFLLLRTSESLGTSVGIEFPSHC